MTWFTNLSPEAQIAIIGCVLAAVKAFLSSREASFLKKAHEAVVKGIEHSNCEDCREACRATSTKAGIENKIKPIIRAIKASINDK